MGQACGVRTADVGVTIAKLQDGCDPGETHNEPIADWEPDYDQGIGTTRVVISANDYKDSGQSPLTCTQDARSMQDLLQACGIGDVTVLLDNENTKSGIRGAVRNVAGRCRPGDTFVFYYSGHGSQVKDTSGDEADGMDEAFCFVEPNGKITRRSFMADDEFRELVLDSTDEDTNILIICDCCHSGTIADFNSSEWIGRRAVSMSGCADSQTSKDVGGGVFTHCLLYAIADLQQQGVTGYTAATLYNRVLQMKDRSFRRIQDQDIALQWAPHYKPKKMQFPLEPRTPYQH